MSNFVLLTFGFVFFILGLKIWYIVHQSKKIHKPSGVATGVTDSIIRSQHRLELKRYYRKIVG